MYHKYSERGQALVIIALAAVGLVAFTALAIDGGMVFSDRRHAQNAADTAAFAAALAKIRTPGYPPNTPADPNLAAVAAGLERAASNGYDNDGTTNIVEVNIPPISGPYAGNDDYIQVIITSHVRTMFARIVGRAVVTNITDAVTRAQTGSSDTSSGLAAISALSPTGIGVNMNGNVTLDVINSGIFSNSNSLCSINAQGNGTFNVDTGYTYATGGSLCQNGNINIDESLEQSGAQIPYPPTNINPPLPSFDCLAAGSVSSNTISPGRFISQLSINGSGAYTFLPGDYCFDNGVSINGNISVEAHQVNFRINASSFSINGNTNFNCSEMLVYGAGGTGMAFNGNGVNTCSETTFYMASGKVVLNGNAANTFSAPTSGIYKGLLIYLPYTNTTELSIDGNSNQNFTGSIIAVGSPIIIRGNSGTFAVNSQFVGYTFTVSGNINFTVNYDPALQYLPPESPAIELIE